MMKFNFLLLMIAFISHEIIAQPSTLQTDGETIAFLKKFRSAYSKSMLDKKLEGIADFYSEKIRLMPEFYKTIVDKKNALLYYQAFLTRFDVHEYDRRETEILDLGSQVLELGSFTTKMVLNDSRQEFEMMGKYMTIWEKKENGTLSLITEAWNYSQRYEAIAPHLKFEAVQGIITAFQTVVPVDSHISFELAALNQLLGVTITQHDAKRWSQFFADDAILLANYYPPYVGREAVDGYISMHVNELPIFEKLDIRNDHIDDLGQYVIEYASHVALWRTGEYSGISTGKNIRVWRREPDCSLKIFRHIAMYD